MSKSNKAFRVMTEDGQYPLKHQYLHSRNIFYTRGEAELLKVSIKAYNQAVELIIEESDLNWK